MAVFWAVVVLAGGVLVLVKGADVFVDGAASLAARLGVSSLVIGLTVVAFGTSLPEFFVNLIAALNGTPNLGLGNVIGSNIANLGLILGLAAVAATLRVHSAIIYRELPFLFLASLALLFALLGGRLDAGEATNTLGRSNGLTLLLFFAVYLYYLFAGAIRQRHSATLGAEETATGQPRVAKLTLRQSALYVLAGIALLTVGGRLVVEKGVFLAASMGISNAMIGLMLAPAGTALPEVVTSLTASRRGESDIVVGNVVGSNIFNTLAVLGIAVTITPLHFDERLLQDVTVMLVLSVIVYFVTVNGRRVDRWEGMMLLFLWVSYIAFTIVREGMT